jgi:hypothetical protein
MPQQTRRFPPTGKKNCLFIGEAKAGERGTIIYTLIESSKRRGLESYAHLKDVLTRLPTRATILRSRYHSGYLHCQQQTVLLKSCFINVVAIRYDTSDNCRSFVK